MSDDGRGGEHENIERLLGRLLAESEQGTRERREFREEMRERHAENVERFAGIETRVGELEKNASEGAGARGAAKFLLGLVVSLLALAGGYLKWGK